MNVNLLKLKVVVQFEKIFIRAGLHACPSAEQMTTSAAAIAI